MLRKYDFSFESIIFQRRLIICLKIWLFHLKILFICFESMILLFENLPFTKKINDLLRKYDLFIQNMICLQKTNYLLRVYENISYLSVLQIYPSEGCFSDVIPYRGMLRQRKGTIYYQKSPKYTPQLFRTRIVHTSGTFSFFKK